VAKAGKGSVVIQAPDGRLRLVWTFNRKRYMALGLPDNPVARLVATEKATIIEKELFSGNFDETLAKYKLPQSSQRDRISVVAVFGLFMDFKAKTVDPDTLINYRALLGHLTVFFKGRVFWAVTEDDAFSFRD
jgi:integrase